MTETRTWRSSPLLERKALLLEVLGDSKRIRYVWHVEDGLGLFAAAEGIVSKKADGPYRRGRAARWVKIKTPAGRAIVEHRRDWNARAD